MNNLVTQITQSGLPVRASFALVVLWLLASAAMFLNRLSNLLAQMDLAVCGGAGGATILLAGLVLRKILKSSTG